MGPYVAEIFFLQVDEGFWLDAKISKLILCFPILLL